MTRRPTTIDEYLATVRGERRAALDKLRKAIRSIVPNAEECISYGIPAFRLDGAVVAGFCASFRSRGALAGGPRPQADQGTHRRDREEALARLGAKLDLERVTLALDAAIG